jgi:RND family efflux transporter MFP subunit
VDEVDGRVKVATAYLERMETLISFGRVTAPFAGIITTRWADPGAYIAVPTGGSKNGALVTLADIATLRVIVPVPEKEATYMKVGSPVLVVFEAAPQPIKATVSRHGHVVDSQSGTLSVEVDVPNPTMALMPGMFARVRMATECHAQVLTLPVSAVLTEGKANSVFMLSDGKALKLAVKLGFNDGERVEITAGINDKEVVALVAQGLAEGTKVTVVDKL